MPTYKNEKANTWYCKFYYYDWNGKKIQKKKGGFKLKREAQEWENNFLVGTNKSCLDMELSQINDLYAENCKLKLKPTTCADKQSIIEKHILPTFGHLKIVDITTNDIRLWHNDLLKNNNYKATYLRKINAQLSGLFNFAVKYYNLKQNPVALCDNIGKGKANVMQFWTPAEFKTFIEYFTNDIELYTIFHMLFYTGVRIGELLAMTWADINFNTDMLHINKNIGKIKGGDIILTPKTEKSFRNIILPSFLCDILLNYKKQIYGSSPDSQVFNKSTYAIRRALKRGCNKTGVKEIRLHDFRHPYVKPTTKNL